MKNIFKLFIGSILMSSMVLTPALALANNKGDKNEDNKAKSSHVEKRDRDEKEEKNENKNKGCFKSFGHLFAFGWLKKNANIEAGNDCFIPFGIKKKFGGQASTTPDTTAPVITNLKTNPRIGEVVISWATDENSDSTVFYKTSSPVDPNSTSTPSTSQNNRTKNHRVVLRNLSAGTTYYVIVKSKDKSGNSSLSSQISFTTQTPPTTGDSSNPVIKNVVGIVSTSTIQIGWQTNEFTSGRVYFSQNSPISFATSTYAENTALDKNHLIKIPGLIAGTKYYFVIESKDNANNITRSSEFSFTTQGIATPPDTTAPVISLINTTVGSTTIDVSWTTNEPGTSRVYYNQGSSIDPNSTTTPFVNDNTLVLSHSVSIPNLATSTLYQLIIESKDSLSNRGLSGQISTTTLSQ